MDVKLTAKTEELARELATRTSTLEELNGAMRSLMKAALERMLNHISRNYIGPTTKRERAICWLVQKRHPRKLHRLSEVADDKTTV